MADWHNRIVSYGTKPADQFLAHPKNARIHPQFQRDVMRSVLDTVGWVAPVLESTSGYLLDGHERVWQGLQNHNAEVPYVTVEVTEEEEAYILATFDPITSLANYEQQKLDDLLRDVQSDDAAIQQMLAELHGEWVMPDFQPVSADEQPRLDQKAPITCPHCGMEFVPGD
jgi:ParB family chromosome partitioning protein